MDFRLSDEQILLRDGMQRFVSERCDVERRRASRSEPQGFSEDNWAALAGLGFLGIGVSEQSGGFGGRPDDVMVLMEEVGRGLLAEPMLSAACIALPLLARHGNAAQQERWLTPGLIGRVRVGFADAEPGARYDATAPGTRVAGGRLNGTKRFVLDAAGASAWLVTANDDDGLAVYLVPADRPGISKQDYRILDGSIAAELRFDSVEAGTADRLEINAAGLESLRARATVAACAEMVGIMDRLLAETLDYAKTRRQFGTAIGDFQVNQHRLARLYIALEQSRSLLLKAALVPEDDRSVWLRSVATAKAYIAEEGVRLAHECIQLHGGMGITDELIIGHGHKRIVLLSRLFGDASTARQHAANRACPVDSQLATLC